MAPRAAVLMIQGCASGVGKSIIAAGLCRLLQQRGIAVAPFKAVSIALNSGVSGEGLEMARAQLLQAWAARTQPRVAMNPVLIKPEGAGIAQIVILGRPRGRIADDGGDRRREAWTGIRESLAELRRDYQAVIIEGSGSPAEPNLMRRDLANMRVARLARAPVLLVGDIEHGGVFAALAGTLGWLPPLDRARVRGLIINRHHGRAETLASAIKALERRAGKPVLGVLPHIRALRLSEEDTLVDRAPNGDGRIDIAVIRLPHMANFTDFEPLSREDGAAVRFCDRAEALGGAHAIIVPGTKSTMADLEVLRRTGMADALMAAAQGGVLVFGICGGFQMLGERLEDPDGVEGEGSVPGLGLLPIRTRFKPVKTTKLVRGTALIESPGIPISGYEIHMGQTRRARGVPPFSRLHGHFDGAMAPDRAVMGTYVHGIFDEPAFRSWFLRRASRVRRQRSPALTYRGQQEADLDLLARVMEQHLDLEAVWRIMDAPKIA